MKIFNSLFTLVFLGFAAVQYNDPDPYLWTPIYGSMAALCVAVIFRNVSKYIYLGLSLVFAIYALLLSPSVVTWLKSDNRSQLFDELAKMQNLYIEETREFLGLMICLAVLAINYFFLQPKAR